MLLTPGEILEHLSNKGVNISRKTLLNYEDAGFFALPERGGHGQGKGRYTLYSDEIIPVIYAIYHTYNNGKPSPWEVGKIIKTATVFEKNPVKFIDIITQQNFELHRLLGQNEPGDLIIHKVIKPVFRFVLWKEYYTWGKETTGLRLKYSPSGSQYEVETRSDLYSESTTYGEIQISGTSSFQVRILLFPSAETRKNAEIDLHINCKKLEEAQL